MTKGDNNGRTPPPGALAAIELPGDEKTDPAITSAISSVAGGGVPPNTADVAREMLVQLVADGGGGGAPPPMFLGVTKGGWTKMLFGLIVMTLLAGLTWVLFVRDDLKDLRTGQEHHEVHGHDDTNKTIDSIQKVQTVQGEQLRQIDKGINDIKRELKLEGN